MYCILISGMLFTSLLHFLYISSFLYYLVIHFNSQTRTIMYLIQPCLWLNYIFLRSKFQILIMFQDGELCIYIAALVAESFVVMNSSLLWSYLSSPTYTVTGRHYSGDGFSNKMAVHTYAKKKTVYLYLPRKWLVLCWRHFL